MKVLIPILISWIVAALLFIGVALSANSYLEFQSSPFEWEDE